jgi:CRISPR/Cas system-associated exonuclease Cas4 (RecB family)
MYEEISMFIGEISHSKRDTYKQCGWKFLLKYYERIPESGNNADAMQFGSYIHKIFELGVSAKTYDELVKIAEEQRPNYTFNDSYNKKVFICLKNFLRFNATLEETVGTEVDFKVPLLEGTEQRVVIDRIIKSKKGNYLIIDYKTSADEKSKLDLFNNDQLKAYTYAASKHFNVPVNRITAAHYYPLTNNFVPVAYLPGQIHKYVSDVQKDVWDIRKKKKEDFCPRKNEFCNWCGYKDKCTEFHSPEDVRARIDEAKKSVKENKLKN